MKGIDSCFDCAYYKPRTQRCGRCAKVKSLNAKGFLLFADCPLEDVKPVKHRKGEIMNIDEINEVEILLCDISDKIYEIEELVEKVRCISGKYTTLYDIKEEQDETHT